MTSHGGSLWGRPIGRVLTKMGKMTQGQVMEALTLQSRDGGKLGEILVRMGYVTAADVEAALTAQRGETKSNDEWGDQRSGADVRAAIVRGVASLNRLMRRGSVCENPCLREVAEFVGRA